MSDSFADRLNAWRTPLVILVCGCLIGLIGFGPRSTFGFFLTPMTAEATPRMIEPHQIAS